MYVEHFRLKSNPFSPTPGPGFIYSSGELREALAHFSYALENREAFLMLTGEVGTGKTTAVQHVLRLLPEGTPVAVVTHTTLNPRELLEEVANKFGIPDAASASKPTLLNGLERFFLDQWALGRQSLLILDEAHLLSPAVLEEVRLLSNLEREGGKLVQICLVGQPELVGHLQKPELRQLRQRISVRYALKPLSASETQEYIHHRLQAAGSADPGTIFTDGAAKAVHRMTHGIPREINVVAAQALLNAFVSGASRVERNHVESVQSDYGFEGLANVQPEMGSRSNSPAPPPPTVLDREGGNRPSPAAGPQGSDPDSQLPPRKPIPLPPEHLKPGPPKSPELSAVPDPEPEILPAGEPSPVKKTVPAQKSPQVRKSPPAEKPRPVPKPKKSSGSRSKPNKEVKVELGGGRRRASDRRNLLPYWIVLLLLAAAAIWYFGREGFPIPGQDSSAESSAVPRQPTGPEGISGTSLGSQDGSQDTNAKESGAAGLVRDREDSDGGVLDTESTGDGGTGGSTPAGGGSDSDRNASDQIQHSPGYDENLSRHFIVLPDAQRPGVPITAQIASFKSRAVADSVLAEAEGLTRLGGVVLPARVGGEPWFRILLGRFQNPDSAREALSPLVRAHVVSDVVIRSAPSGVLPLLTAPR